MARNLPFRLAFNGAAMGLYTLFYLTKNQEMHRLKGLSISVEMVFGIAWRVCIMGVIADQMSRRLFVNY